MHFLLLSLLACPGLGGKDSDTGASGCGAAPEITGINADPCDDTVCVWTIDATSEMGTVTLQIDETGDPSGDCGPGKGGLNKCNEWSETHTAFIAAGSGGAGGACAEAKSIDLNVVDDFKKQQDNDSTLFNSNAEMGQITVLVTVTDAAGNYADCAVTGNEVSFFASECTNEL